MRSILIVLVLFFFASIGLIGCASPRVFPSGALEGIDHNFDFARWRVTPDQDEGKKIQLGGRIIYAEESGNAVTIAVAELPVVDHPAYGPKETGKYSGDFVITYKGKVRAPFLQPGNRVMVVGTIRPPTVVKVDDLPRTFPTVTAQCLHFWNTEGRDISDFPYYDGGYATLEEQTVCTSNP